MNVQLAITALEELFYKKPDLARLASGNRRKRLKPASRVSGALTVKRLALLSLPHARPGLFVILKS